MEELRYKCSGDKDILLHGPAEHMKGRITIPKVIYVN